MVDPLKEIYERSSTFGRDFFHYVVAGTVLGLACLIGFLLSFRMDTAWLEQFQRGSAVLILTLVLLSVVMLYVLGQLTFAVGVLLRNCWMRVFGRSKHVKRFKDAKSDLRNVTTDILTKVGENPLKNDADQEDAHLIAEMFALKHTPELHAKFVERYNTLLHLRLSLASSLVLSGLVNLALFWITLSLKLLTLIAGLWIFAAVVMYRAVVTNTGFFNRVIVAAFLSKELET